MGTPVPLALELSDKYLRYSNFAAVEYQPFDYKDAVRCADFYEDMTNNPQDMQVIASYEVFKNHLMRQFILLQRTGFEFIDGLGEFEYPSSEALRDDMRSGHTIYLPTYSNHGTSSEISKDHPLAGFVIVSGTRYCFNDIFRIVHDFYGHGPGHSFSPKGEHEAWNAHRTLLPREAHLALWCETRAQSSWVNFGRHIRNSEEYIIPADRPFAIQKVGIPPFDLI